MRNKKYEASILLSGIFWGVIGLFTRRLNACGIDSSGVLLIRSGGCALLFGLAMLLTKPKNFAVRLKDIWLFFCFGVVATLFFTYCYYLSIGYAGMGVGCTLMYTAPLFVTLMSLLIFHERFTKRKLLALVLALCGVALVSGIIGSGETVSPKGILFGLLAGIGYALYSIFSKLLSQKGYQVLQINFYGWLFCFLGGIVIWGLKPAAPLFSSAGAALSGAGLVLISGFLPSLLYNWALGHVEASKASMMVSIEPVVSTVAGIVFYHESLSLMGAFGIALVLGAVVLLNLPDKKAIAI